MNFVAIDFETANEKRYSPCEIGIAIVEDNKVVEKKSWLIRPKDSYFNSFNVMIHGIDEDMVANEPEFDIIWNEVKPHLENQYVVAHNAGFDISVLRHTLDLYNISYPNFKYLCSYIASKKVWTGLIKYDLQTLCNLNQIIFKHHRAGEDAGACAELIIKAFQKIGVSKFEDIETIIPIRIGKVFEGGYNSCESKYNHSNSVAGRPVGDPSKHKPEHIFYNKQIIFTGTLGSMVRADAQKIVADIGGVLSDSVSIKTNFLIVGQQDYFKVGNSGLSSKQKKANDLLEKGAEIEILSEDEFLRTL